MNKHKVTLWYTIAVLSLINALGTALSGNAICFAWTVAAGLEWRLAEYLKDREDGK